MNAGSPGFFLLAAIVAATFWTPALGAHGLTILVAANLLMLATWLDHPSQYVALAVLLAPAYFATRLLWGREDKQPKFVVAAAVTFQVILFAIMRHYPPFDLSTVFGQPIAVIGVSYIMFRQVHLIIDAPYSSGPFNVRLFLGYVTSFWTIIAGPIQRYPDFVAGIEQIKRPTGEAALAAAHRIANGLLKALILAPMFSDLSGLRGAGSGASFDIMSWIVLFYGYFIFLFLDFSGYTDIVIGTASLCGFTTLPENFDKPYLSRNVQEFWTRWHMSLGTWFRDYFYNPLLRMLGDMTGWRNFTLVNIAALFVTFTAVGIWHGPSLNFFVFGLSQAVGVVAAQISRQLRASYFPGRSRFPRATAVVAWFFCFHYICGSFLLLNNSVGSVGGFFSELLRWLWR